jgi:hypothetical protein
MARESSRREFLKRFGLGVGVAAKAVSKVAVGAGVAKLVSGCGGGDGGGFIPPITPGFGNNEGGARTFIQTSIDDIYQGESYSYDFDVDALLRNPITDTYFRNIWDFHVTCPDGREVYIEYDCGLDGLSAEAAAGVASRAGMEPALVRIGSNETEEQIRQTLDDILVPRI